MTLPTLPLSQTLVNRFYVPLIKKKLYNGIGGRKEGERKIYPIGEEGGNSKIYLLKMFGFALNYFLA